MDGSEPVGPTRHGGRRRKGRQRVLSNAQIWYVLIAGTLLAFMAIVLFAQAISEKAHEKAIKGVAEKMVEQGIDPSAPPPQWSSRN